MADVIAVISQLAANDPVTPGNPPLITLSMNVKLKPVDGSDSGEGTVSATLGANATVPQWRAALLTQVQALATSAGHTVVRLIGFVDIVTTAV